MNNNIKVRTLRTEPLKVGYSSHKGPYNNVANAIESLLTIVRQEGYKPVGLPSGVFFNNPAEVPAEELSWEVRVPIKMEEPVALGFLKTKEIEAMEMVSTVHQGPYYKIGETYKALYSWVSQNGFEAIGPPQEIYLSDAEEVPMDELLTEIRIPVYKKGH